ncbi:nibrin isoform X1 [Centrocercus urophasianus]|uniref:nibrin isoform X1 n=1 Tax=Centrocercus urophasianus TaxID=9002 RepID=UPI001C654784|nr:nibrin isoform X1 [Centrocercus urophasianus]
MWKLVPAAGPGEPFRLLVGTEYVVGRKNCAILIQDDQSISRSHAVLTVSRPETTHSQSVSVPVLTIKDTSKYGTSVNGSKLSGTSRTLQSGDRVNFGVFESKFRVEYESLVVCSSCLDVAQKTALNEAIQQLGGLVVNEWTKECTHLIMASVKVTVKTICALICGRPIVKPEFFNELMKAVQSRQQLPTPENFYPSVDEPSIGIDNMDLTGRPERKKIFSGKTFVFLTAKQHKKLGPAVVLGGGEAKLMTEGRKETSLLVSPEVCVVDVGMTNSQILGSESMRNWTDSILTVLESNNLRAIPEAEIGLAVIFMSTERYCNPQRQPDNKAVTANAASGAGPAISQSLAVDETIMPTAAADNSALYVADTEIEEQTCMEIENKTSQTKRREKGAFQQTSVKENPSTSGTANTGTLISKVNRTSGFSQKNHPASPSKILEGDKPRECTPRQQSNSITNYFHVARKRERAEEGEDTSVPKLAKLEKRPLLVSKCTESSASSTWDSEKEQHRKGNNIQLGRETSEIASDKTDTKITFSENPAPKKRKELGDVSEDLETLEMVFESRDLDWEEQTANGDQEAQSNKRKRRCLETKGSRTEEGNTKQREENEMLRKDEVGSVLTLEEKSEIEEESSVSVRNKFINHNKLEDDSSHLPSKLLLTEFRSLVVSCPRPNSPTIRNTKCRGQNNFKTFRKVPYPGAGQLPYIIGGSDLVAHQTRKNSELEEWLREELEEQNRRAREESLADDLFRYDPNVKRRR